MLWGQVKPGGVPRKQPWAAVVGLGAELVLELELEVVAAQLGRSHLAQYLRHQAAGSLLHRRRLIGMVVVVMARAVLAGLHWRLAPH